MDRCQRPIVTRVHGLQHVERLTGAALSDDDTIGAHAEGIAHEVALKDRAATFDIGWARFKADPVFLLKLEFRWILDANDPLTITNKGRQHIEKGRLSGAGATGNEYVQPACDARPQ